MFQSPPPARGATRELLETFRPHLGFNPRPPRGGRLQAQAQLTALREFQSPPPARGAT